MSELLDSYKSQMPAKCLDCPTFAAFVAACDAHESSASHLVASMFEAHSTETTELSATVREVQNSLLDIATSGEVRLFKDIGKLARHGSECPTPKRGAVEGVSLPGKIAAWLANEHICQNPGLKEILER